MKEHLKTEIGHWFDKLDDKYGQLVNSYSNGDIRETAEHFYNLALIDVRKELDKRVVELKKRSAELGTFESDEIGIYDDIEAFNDIISFINGLGK